MKHLTFLFFACLLCTSHLVAQDKYIEVNNIRYRIITEADGAATFGTVSVAPSEYDDYEGDMEIPMTVKDSDEEFAESYRVIGIDDGAFRKSNIKSIKIPSSVESIGNYAFENSALKVIVLPVGNLKNIGNHSFSNTSIEEINLPINVKEIGRCAFANCKNLVKAILKDGILSLGDSAFFQCYKLRECHIPSLLTKIEDYTFCGCVNLCNVVLGEEIRIIGENAFAFCASLDTLVLPSSLRVIKAFAFAHTGIMDIVIPDKVKEINYGTFCKSQLRKIKLPEGLETIKAQAFYETELISINIPKTTIISKNGIGIDLPDGRKLIQEEGTSLQKNFIKNLDIIRVSESDLEFLPIEFKNPKLTNPEFLSKRKSIKIGEHVFLLLEIPNEDKAYGKLRLVKWDPNATGNVIIPDAVEIERKKSNKKYLITEIGSFAFDNTEKRNDSDSKISDNPPSVKYVKLGKYIDKIHDAAFGSSTVQKVDLPNIPLPANLFMYSSLKEFIFPPQMRAIPDGFFSGCKSLTSITIPPYIKKIGKSAFEGTGISKIVIPNGVTKISASAFSGCVNLKEILLPNSVDSICSGAFRNNISISNLVIPSTVSYIGERAFGHCENIRVVTLPKNAKIDPYAFDNNNIVKAIIADGAVEVKKDAFARFSKLKEVTLPNSVTKICDKAFAYTPIETIKIPEGVKEIGIAAFQNCKELKSITIPSTVEIIKREAFEGCKNLTAVEIKDGVNIIDERAFRLCPIENLIIPKSVQKVKPGAFIGTKTVWIRCDLANWRSSSAIFDKKTLLWYKLDIPFSGYTETLGLTTLKE